MEECINCNWFPPVYDVYGNMVGWRGRPVAFCSWLAGYLQDGHLHHLHEDHVDQHVVAVNVANPVQCMPQTRCSHMQRN